MRVFILSTGRCGSTSFARACSHITNYTTGHETQVMRFGPCRLDYPDRHIEVDNRLSWFLGSLDRRYGDEAFYVHLTRDPAAVARSYARRLSNGKSAYRRYRTALALARRDETQSWIMDGFGHHIVIRSAPYSEDEALRLACSFVATVTDNIELFLGGKSRVLRFPIEVAEGLFPKFWAEISAEGDFSAALAEFGLRHNAHA
jgi:hypothetical protein